MLFLSALAGYAFAKKRFRGKEVMFWSFLAMVMVPFHVTLIPTFILMANLGGVDTYWGLILPSLANAQAVFLMRQFIRDCRMSCSSRPHRRRGRVPHLPADRAPAVQADPGDAGIFVFLWHWNDFLWPLIIAKSNAMFTHRRHLVAAAAERPAEHMLAGSVVALLPIFLAYLIAQR